MTVRITNLRHVLDAVTRTPWSILPEKLDAIAEALSVRLSDEPLTPEQLAARVGGKPGSGPSVRTQGAVAVIPLFGTIMPRANMMTDFSGGTSVSQWIEQVRAAVNNPDISAVVLEVDSPGGATAGIPEAADALYAMRGQKPIVAVANTLMASAAYWLGAQADSVVASPSADVGSVGVYMVHRDLSRAMQNDGVTHTVIRAGKYKAEALPFEPLSADARQEMQARVDEAYDQFIGALARGRDVSPSAVRSSFGEGRVLSAQRALAAGMIDRVATLDEVVSELTAGKGARAGRTTRATHPDLALVAETTYGALAADLADISYEPFAALDSAADTLLASDPSAGSADAALPSRIETAPQAEETTVSTVATPAPSGAATAPDRIAQLAELVELRPEAASRLPVWIRENTSYDAAKAELAAGLEGASPSIRVGTDRATVRPWDSLGEFAAAVARAGMPNARSSELDPRLFAAAQGMNQQGGSDGGFTVPGQFSNTLWMGIMDDPNSLLGLCDRYDVDGEFLEFPAIDETTRTTTVYGGVRAYWINEADQITKSAPKFRKVRLEPQELAALVYVTEKLINNSPVAMGQYVDRAARAAIVQAANTAIVSGDGVGKPKGLTKSGAKVTVSKEASQAAATIQQENVSKMWARTPAGIRSRLVWLHNVDVEPALDTLSTVVKNVAGTENVGGYANKVFDAERRTLKGRPLIANDACETLGTEGDLILFDPMSYAIGLRRAGVKTAQSMHVRFEYAEMAFRFMFDIDGQSWLNSAVTPQKGANTLSSIITLQTR